MNKASTHSNFWHGKRVLVTGHTGFKGSWLSIWLQSKGAKVLGLALPPETKNSLFNISKISENMKSEFCDIRDLASVKSKIQKFKPEIIFHMAAQALVRKSYSNPIETYEVNLMGTLNILESSRRCGSVKAIINVTSDKCYDNKEWIWGYREDHALGGLDPYSNSKACVELISSAYTESFFRSEGIAMATARAGNVIGGGDWSSDRLIPDILEAFVKKKPVMIRNPKAVRPWQHVLEPLSGYIELAEKLYNHGNQYVGPWNFGPLDHDSKTVEAIVKEMSASLGHNAKWELQKGEHPHEASQLKLDISKSINFLDWKPRWSLSIALVKIIEWHDAWINGLDVKQTCLEQIKTYEAS